MLRFLPSTTRPLLRPLVDADLEEVDAWTRVGKAGDDAKDGQV